MLIMVSIMQKSFNIISASGEYKCTIGQNLLIDFLNSKPEAILIIDANLLEYIGNAINKKIIIQATEQTKDLTQIPNIITKLKEYGATRQTELIGIGGGIIQDLTCFTASIYMRGIEWFYFPTTALGMMDSCIGGKSSINVAGVKNLVGNFYPPKEIFIDSEFAKSLDKFAVISGIMEAVKICYTTSNTSPAFNAVCQFAKVYIETDDLSTIRSISAISLMEKKWFIENDEFDKKERQLLNFGHTFGHAIESITNYSIPHGIAIGIGMVCAIEMAKIMFNFEAKNLRNILNILLKPCKNSIDIFQAISFQDFLIKFQTDKKHTKTHYCLILPNESEGFALSKMLLEKTQFNEEKLEIAIENAKRICNNIK